MQRQKCKSHFDADPQLIDQEVLVTTIDGAMISLGQVVKGTPGVRTANALLFAYIFVDIRDRDIGVYVLIKQWRLAKGLGQ